MQTSGVSVSTGFHIQIDSIYEDYLKTVRTLVMSADWKRVSKNVILWVIIQTFSAAALEVNVPGKL